VALSDPFFVRADADEPRGPGRTPRAATRRELLLAALIAFLFALPFVDKAVAQDDWAYLTAGALASEHGAGDVRGLLREETLYQGRPITLAQGILHGPVWIATLAGIDRVFGDEHRLAAARVLTAALLALLAAATAALGARLGAPPLVVGLGLALAPGPLMLAGTAMTDLPMLALFVAALALACEGGERGSLALLVLAGVVGGACALLRYPGAAVIPLLAALPLLWGRVSPRAFAPAAIAAALLGAWLWWSRASFGAMDVSRGLAALERAASQPRVPLLAAVAGAGGMAAGWLAAGAFAPRRALSAVLSDPLKLAAGVGGLAVGAWLAIDAHALRGFRPGGVNGALQALFLMFGAVLALAALLPWIDAAAWRAGASAWRRRRGRDAWLGLWLIGAGVGAVAFVPFGAARYALPALPAVVLLAGLFAARRLGGLACRAGLFASAALGVACAIADEDAARVYAEYGAEIGARRAPDGVWSEHDLWVWGELGFRWYLERDAGARVLPSDSEAPRPGDRILRSGLCTAADEDGRTGLYVLGPGLRPRMYTEDHFVATDGWPLRVHNPRAGAGFYHASAGLLPWALSRAPHDEIQTWLIKEPSELLARFDEARVDRLDDAPPEPSQAPPDVRVERFRVRRDLPSYPALRFGEPARVTWSDVLVPADAPWLVVHVGESYRLAFEDVDAPPVRATVAVDGVPVAVARIDGRRRDEDRRWFELSADLSDRAGERVRVAFEVAPQRSDVPEGTSASSGVLLVGFADPRFSPEPLAGSEPAPSSDGW